MKLVVYDLPSENKKAVIENGDDGRLYEKVKNLRIRCVRALHSLGLMCTESVIIVSPSMLDKVNDIIAYVETQYREFERANNVTLGRPLIRVLPLTEEQIDTFRALAQRNLQERLDNCIDAISTILESISDIISSERANKVRRNILRLRREWLTIRDLAEDLGIDLGRDYDYLIRLIDRALAELRGS